ncbi:fetuin-B-like [Pelobates fuscus]|uniref:fetuin-B-like n=1 Tax=Pelobates fuscus TaxID=191477 RepID=UPI002FE4F7CD
MEKACALILFALIYFCDARSPPRPRSNPIPLDCNATETEAGLALDLINEVRDGGFVLKPFRVVRAYEQKSLRPGGGSLFYLTVDVLETKCSVLSGVSWKNCSDDISFHNAVFGQCSAAIFISGTKEKQKLFQYNCTLSPVPSSAIFTECPDCPVIVTEPTPEVDVGKLVEEYNKESNNTNYFKAYHLERVRMQTATYFVAFTIKETDCLKTQSDVVLSDCNFLADKDADVGFCIASIFVHDINEPSTSVSCEIYGPKDDDDYHRGHGGYTLDKENSKPRKNNCNLHDHRERHRHHHHQRHHDHHPHHHDYNSHHGQHRRHHGHHSHHKGHHHVKGHNHTSSEQHDSSSEEHTDRKLYFKKSKGSVQIIYLDEDGVLPETTITATFLYRHYPNDFPESLGTCPGKPIEELPLILKYLF